ncbi:MAG TPA: basic secretory protein-like protein [Gemmatimonadales bacterium]
MRSPAARLRTHAWVVVAALASIASAPTTSSAQYFGRNKVQYENFDWRVLSTPHFDVHFYPAESLAAHDAGRMAERWYTRLVPALRDTFDRRSLIFYANSPDFQQTNVVSGLIGQGTGGVTESLRGRVVMPFQSTYAETDHVLGHEMVHVFQYNIAFGGPDAGKNAQGLNTIPLWVIEGMAEYLSVGREDALTAMWLRDAVRRDDIPTLKQLTTDSRYFPYRYGQAFWAWFAGLFGDPAVERVYRTALRQGWEQSLRTVTGQSSDSLSAAWARDLRAYYTPLMVGRAAPDSVGTRIVGQSSREGDQNFSPSLSPDGRYVSFFSSRDLFGYSLLVAEVATGRVVKELATPASDPHFDALSFLSSAGSWSPDGRYLAYVAYAQGDEEIEIFDIESGDVERRIRPTGVDAISDPAWSPDGRRLAFSGNVGGITDLYVLELESGQLRQLTRGRAAELQPVWAPDGNSIVYVTDGGPGFDEARLTFGEMQLVRMDVATGRATFLPSLGAGKHINPQFSPDGGDIYFINDQDGFPDIYRLDVASGQIYRVTRVATGVAGITRLSPALSIASRDGQIVFASFNDAGYQLRGMTPAEAQGTPVEQGRVVANAALVPPVDVRGGFVTRYLADPLTGLPAPDVRFEVSDYRPGLSLDYIGVPQVGVQVGGPFGTGVSGAAAAYFADELNNRTVGVSLIARGELKDIGGSVFYLNQEKRLNWFAGAGRTPYLGLFAQIRPGTIDTPEGPLPVDVYEQILQRVYIDEVSTGLQYPLSTTRRLELSGGFQRISYDLEAQQLIISGGRVIGEDRVDLEAPPAVNFGTASAAFVGDYSFFGFTSPVAGGRYRFEVGSTFGSFSYQTALADYRRYFFMRPVTFAVRGMHYGRYGGGADDRRLYPLFIGYPQYIRGYEQTSFDASECQAGSDPSPGGCPVFDRLFGSRIAIANAELRVPLFGTADFGLFNLPFLPTELTFFGDAGLAWSGDQSPDIRFDRSTNDRVPVVSAGASARVNVLGYMVVEFYYAFPFQRPDKSGVFGFHLAPGW